MKTYRLDDFGSGTSVRDQAIAIARLRSTLQREAVRSLTRRKPGPKKSDPDRAARLDKLTLISALKAEARRIVAHAVHDSVDSTLEAATRTEQASETLAGRGRLRAAFWLVMGTTPKCAPGDTATAMQFWRKVQSALGQDGWTRNERTQLLELDRVWGPRARGTDARFMEVGNRPGRLPRGQEARIVAARLNQKVGA